MTGIPPIVPPGLQEPEPLRSRWWVYVEDALIVFLGIGVLWLSVLRISGPGVLVAQIVALAAMVAIMVVRVRRLLSGRRRAEDEARKL